MIVKVALKKAIQVQDNVQQFEYKTRRKVKLDDAHSKIQKVKDVVTDILGKPSTKNQMVNKL